MKEAREKKKKREDKRKKPSRSSCESDLAEFPSSSPSSPDNKEGWLQSSHHAPANPGGISLPLRPSRHPIVFFYSLLPPSAPVSSSFPPSPLSFVPVSSPFHLLRQQPYALRFARGSNPSVTPVNPRRFAVGAIWPLLHAGYITAALLNYARYFSFRWEKKGGSARVRLPPFPGRRRASLGDGRGQRGQEGVFSPSRTYFSFLFLLRFLDGQGKTRPSQRCGERLTESDRKDRDGEKEWLFTHKSQ